MTDHEAELTRLIWAMAEKVATMSEHLTRLAERKADPVADTPTTPAPPPSPPAAAAGGVPDVHRLLKLAKGRVLPWRVWHDQGLATCDAGPTRGGGFRAIFSGAAGLSRADGTYLAAAANACPGLCAEILRLREELGARREGTS